MGKLAEAIKADAHRDAEKRLRRLQQNVYPNRSRYKGERDYGYSEVGGTIESYYGL